MIYTLMIKLKLKTLILSSVWIAKYLYISKHSYNVYKDYFKIFMDNIQF